MKICSNGKKCYATSELAEDALIAAWITYALRPGAGPVNVYQCSDCGEYHLTSKGQMNTRLEASITSGKIDKSKEADAWLAKLKKKGRGR